jgi:hypothetical protein
MSVRTAFVRTFNEHARLWFSVRAIIPLATQPSLRAALIRRALRVKPFTTSNKRGAKRLRLLALQAVPPPRAA